MWHSLRQLIDILVDAMVWLSGGVALLMVLHIGADIVGRSVFNQPIVGTSEIIPIYYMVGLTYLPLAVITRNREHMRVMLFTEKAPPRLSLGFDIFSNLVMLLFVGLVLVTSFQETLVKTRVGELTESSLPSGYLVVWPSRWVLVVSFALMLVYIVLNLIQEVARLIDETSTQESGK